MKGYLMQEKDWVPAEDLFIESFSPENAYGVVFEDDGDTAYFYAVEKDAEGAGMRVLDALHIWDKDCGTAEPGLLQIVWSGDWLKAALVIGGRCHALFDFEAHGGYNVNEFPPPNGIWTRGERKLTAEVVERIF
ncbi:MAG TPA: DUF2251 domain-containing protein [Puia sp.]|nr:DUF2251 domain-containing protein [Puia sp.]